MRRGNARSCCGRSGITRRFTSDAGRTWPPFGMVGKKAPPFRIIFALHRLHTESVTCRTVVRGFVRLSPRASADGRALQELPWSHRRPPMQRGSGQESLAGLPCRWRRPVRGEAT
eukprot:1929587-Prymnesium_polylepis.1